MSLDKIRLGPRLALGFGIVLMLVAAIAALGWSRLHATWRDMDASDAMRERAARAAAWRAQTQLNVTRTLALAKAGAGTEITTYLAPQIKQTSAQISELQATLERAVDATSGKPLMAEIAELRTRYVGMRDVIFKQLKAQEPGAWQTIEQQLIPAAEAYMAALTRFQDLQQQLADSQVAATGAAVRRAQWLLAGLAALCLAIGACAAWAITRSVTRPLQHAVLATQRIAAGDLSQPIDARGRDEVGAVLGSLQAMQQSLRSLVGDVHQASESIRVASSEVAAGSLDLSNRTEETASSLQQTASSMEQIAATVRHTADSARTANELSSTASHAAGQGGEVVAQVISTMEQIRARSGKVNDITGLIDAIAFQTNLLALNAAVEAARAGEHGRGFAVVAAEVRTLAQRASGAANEIRTLINDSAQTVDHGAALVLDAGRVMAEIVASVQRVSGIVSEISSAAGEQSNGIGQVNVAVSQLDQMTQSNAALVEQSAAAAASLQQQAARLKELIEAFRIH